MTDKELYKAIREMEVTSLHLYVEAQKNSKYHTAEQLARANRLLKYAAEGLEWHVTERPTD